MTTLVLLWPGPSGESRPADDAQAQPASLETPPPATTDAALAFVLSSDGLSVADQGEASPARLPRADTVVAVLPPKAVSWHRLTLPKAPAGRMRAALAGLLEERLLADDGDTHLALAPGARAGQPCWVAAVHKAPFAAQLGAWAAAGIHPDRVVAAMTPGGQASAHIHADGHAPDLPLNISLADDSLACTLPLEGSLARARVAEFQARHGAALRVTASPGGAAAAERWLGQPVLVRGDAEQALLAARTGWELRQFDLAPSLRGTRMIGRLARRLTGPDWRWARWGLAAAVAIQLVGLNLTAWRLERAIGERKQAQVDLLRAAYPQVRAVLDAPLQMRRETDRLRSAAGIADDAGLEALIAVAGRAWPPEVPPTPMLRYEPGRLTLAAAGWQPAQVAGFSERLRGGGWRAEFARDQVVITKAEGEADAAPPAAGPGPGAPPALARPPGVMAPAKPRGQEAS